MSPNTKAILNFLSLLVVVGAISLGLGYTFGLVLSLEEAKPQQAFEAHIQATADGEWGLAHSYFAEGCNVAPWEIERAFGDGLDPGDWGVDKVFLGDDEALLWFSRTGGIQYMVVEGGDWKISCKGEIR